MLLLRWLWIGNGNDGEVPPIAVFWTLRVLMFALSFVLEDWAIHELVPSSRHRKIAVLLVASSYVTWTYQTHTFSNSIETLGVAWSLVLIQRIVEDKVGGPQGWREAWLTRCSATIFPFCILNSCFCGCVWNIQSNYLSSLFTHTWSTPYTPFPEKVSLSFRQPYSTNSAVDRSRCYL